MFGTTANEPMTGEDKAYYSTSEVAVLCRVHKNTIIAAINRGLLAASKTPGGHNRVGRTDLATFMRERGIPTGVAAVPPVVRVLIVGESAATVKRIRKALPSPQFDVVAIPGLFEAGLTVARQRPDILVMPADAESATWAQASAEIRQVPECRKTRLVGLSESGAPPPGGTFDVVVPREAKASELVDAISRLAR